MKREVVDYIIGHYGLKLARACRLIKQAPSTQYRKSTKDPKLALRQLGGIGGSTSGSNAKASR